MEKIIPDTSIIIEGILSKRIENKELNPKIIIIHEAVISELEAQANKGRETGHLGLEEIKKLRDISKKYKFTIEFKGVRPGDFEIRRAKSGEIDSIIRELALVEKGTLITADKVQAIVAESKGVDVILYEFPKEELAKEPVLAKFFDANTMSIHLKEDCVPKAKKGRPGDWQYVTISDVVMTGDDVKELAKQITEETGLRKDSFIEIDRRGSTIIQLSNYRIVITRPPFADGYEITAVRPVKRLTLKDYNIPEKLMKRISVQAEGILISGAPGHGKSTFAQALAEFYALSDKVIKTIEAPRDLILPPEVTQYSISHGSSQEIHDILLLSRPDYTIFDEMRNTEDFRLFADLRLSGVGMIGVMHATKSIDAIQRFIGRIELGVIPHIVDTVIFIRDGQISNVFSLSMEVKVPSGMFEQDLARPVVVIHDFNTGRLEFEIYTYGEQTVVIPVSSETKAPTHSLAADSIKREFLRYSDNVNVDVVSNNKCVVYVPDKHRSAIIGKNGSNIEKIEKKLGLSIDIRDLQESKGEHRGEASKVSSSEPINFTVKIHKSNLTFMLAAEYSNVDVDLFLDGEYILTARSSKKAIIKISKNNQIGKVIIDAVKYKENLELKSSK
ncbi:MAG: PINc/VapC family ATPase [Nanoarchaeota archaeon]|nr:PINc/VapC family ATPase [Nanoarchaeota archaeon]MBU1270390.1 PINc/VapC family ATPase [Nanoarchaeota archaeon]MBU1604821.1 PINc/VapC family ATPase [Nanoarchaeota archaeon]MBU2442804.1 PINc/VapC family ATPase [Nanoarchaeota archaeon]